MTAWLMIVAGDDRQHGGNDGYDDHLESYYSWNESVPNARNVRIGDQLVFWDKERLRGAALVEDIVETAAEPVRKYACPFCGGRPKARKTQTPVWKCQSTECGKAFHERRTWVVELRGYRAQHKNSWVGLESVLNGKELRAMAVSPGSQHAMRELRWDLFASEIDRRRPKALARMTGGLLTSLKGGHKVATVQVRVGQGKFREELLRKYGPVCAFSGPSPVDALEAAHLYSFAINPQHDFDGGGFLLRRDLHRLFDGGHMTVNPVNATIEISSQLEAFPEYSRLAGKVLHVKLTPQHKAWMEQHRQGVWKGRH
jgi:ribosomal protein L37AE/L43A